MIANIIRSHTLEGNSEVHRTYSKYRSSGEELAIMDLDFHQTQRWT